jgi:hypothetical protein
MRITEDGEVLYGLDALADWLVEEILKRREEEGKKDEAKEHLENPKSNLSRSSCGKNLQNALERR